MSITERKALIRNLTQADAAMSTAFGDEIYALMDLQYNLRMQLGMFRDPVQEGDDPSYASGNVAA